MLITEGLEVEHDIAADQQIEAVIEETLEVQNEHQGKQN